MSNKNLLALIATMCAVIIPTLKAEDMEDMWELDGIGYHIEEAHTGLLYLSMEGGAPITIYGQMMANNIANNFIVFNPNWIEGVSVFGPPLSDDDEFNAGNFHSNAMAGRLAYTTPSVATLMNAEYSMFNGDLLPNGYGTLPTFFVDVHNTDDGINLMCANKNNCRVRYHRSYTPSLYAITPNQVCMDDYIQFHLNVKDTHNTEGTPASAWPFREMRIGETLVDWEFTVNQDYRLTRWGMDTLEAHVTEMSPQFNLKPNLLFYTGYQHDEAAVQTCNYAGDDCWKIRVHPKVESVSHDYGFTTGGQQLIITGQGFNGTNVSVSVDGVACEVQEIAYNQITCTTGQAENESLSGFQPGHYGLEHFVLDGTDGFNFANLDNPVSKPQLGHNVSTGFETVEGDGVMNKFGRRMSGWFKAPTTGQYRFYISCDDQCRLYLNSASPFIAGESLTDRPVGDLIASRSSWSGWRDYWHEPDSSNPHRSEWIKLYEGEFYHIQGDHYEGTGSDHFTVSVEIKPDGELATAGARRRRLQDATNSTSEDTTVVETEESTTDSNSTDTTTESDSTVITDCTCTVSNTTTESNVTDTTDSTDSSNSTDTTTNCTCTEEVIIEEEFSEEEVIEEEEEVIDWANVEFIQNHPHVRHTVQQIAIDQDNVFEEWYVTVTNPDAGTYKLNFLHPVSGNVWTSDPIAANFNRWQFRSMIVGYFDKNFASDIEVTRDDYDSNGVLTLESGLSAASLKYTIRLKKVINGFSASAVVVSASKTDANIQVVPPMSGIQSTGPLSGYYKITCTDGEGIDHTSSNLFYRWSNVWVEYHLWNSIPYLVDHVRVLNDHRYDYRENGISYMLDFYGLNYDQPLCKIHEGDNNEPLQGNSYYENSKTLHHFGESIFFEPIPMEMLFTDASTPQIMVKIDGLEALCPSLGCGYSYTTAEPLVESQTLTDGELTVRGTALTSIVDPEVWFGPIHCTTSSITDTQIVCALDEEAVAGEWIVHIKSDEGFVPTTIVNTIRIELQVTSVSPDFDINYLGGDYITFTGVNFGYDPSVISVTLDDGTECDVLSVVQEKLVCMPNRMTASVSSTPVLTISVNGVEDSSMQFTLVDAVKETTQLEPNSVSPVLKSEITIYLGSTYTDAVDPSYFTVTATNSEDPDYYRELYVMSADEASKSIKVKFPGAPSGLYHVQVASSGYGRFFSDYLELNVHATVTNVSPNRGSKYGGTLITIAGENFSDEIYDNPVKIGDSYCFVQTTSATEITCRQDFGVRDTGEAQLLVFLKTSEEAACADDICTFIYDAPSTTVSDIQSYFNQESFVHQVTVTGEGITDDIQLWLDGVQQVLVSVSDTEAVFDVIEIDGVSTDDVIVYTNEGFPEGSEIAHFLQFTPTLFSISPETGNSGGTWITVTGSGFGTSTTGLNLVDQSGNELCQQVSIIEYGVFECLTIEDDIVDGTTFELSLNGVAQSQVVDAAVVYTQASNIVVFASELTGNQVTFAGLNFPLDSTAVATVSGIVADTVQIVDVETVVATWASTGVPAVVDATPTLEFVFDDYSMFAIMQGSITKDLQIISTSEALSCSFAGGCTYAIEAEGLYATLLDSNNRIDVCGNPCVLRDDLSDASYAICELQQLETTYSIEQYQLRESAELHETVFPENSGLYDSDHQTDFAYTDAGCFFGMTMKDGHIALLDQAKVFINFLTDKSPYVDNLVFQGSNDHWASFDDLYVFDDNLHEGWNYINYREEVSKPAYNSYRFYGHADGACRVTEFRLNGVQAIDSTSSSHTCTPSIIIGSESLATETIFGDVTYDNAFTPVLDRIKPRFGSVLGGTTVTLTGTGFTGTSSIHFDDRECTVSTETDTEIVCTTADKPYVPDEPRVAIYVDGMGKVATQGHVYRYVSLWSDTETWGGDIPPLEGESVAIPKGQHLLVDVDSTPQLVAIIVEGSLIFAPNDDDPTHHRTFDCSYIMVQHGYMEIGTHENPYTSKLTITMHGDRFSPLLPLFGNKVIAVHHGTLDMHGVERVVTWTRLAATAQPGDTQITLMQETDWQVGEEIVIAATGWSNKEAETRIITAVDGKTLTLDKELKYQHFSEAPTYDGVEIPMRGEVGLLTRNVLLRGDPIVSPADMYGCQIMLHSEGDDSSIARIEFIEIKWAGQAFKLGKYPIHMHMIGNVHKSYVHGNSVHRTFNRAFTTHGVNYFRVTNNVAFDTMGHTFFIEDGVETNNVYDGNLVVQVKKSHSGLNTDQSPGGWWLTTADNIITNNAVAGTDAYAYWYDMQVTAIGPSYDPNICPEFTKLGVFKDNTAHSTKKYGLRIFHALVPHQYPCKPSTYDANYLAAGKTDPYWQNPKIPAVFENLTAWKCGRNGAIIERSGAVVFKNFKIADNGIAGMEYSIIEAIEEAGHAYVDGGIVVGNSGLNDDDGVLAKSTVWGVIGPRYEWFSIEGTSFYNFESAQSGAIGTCSHCFHGASTDSGGRTVTTTGLKFDDATVPRRIKWQYPYREIIHDLDGSLTGLGENSWATPYYPHNMAPGCKRSQQVHGGIICDGTNSIRRIAFFGVTPDGMMTGMKLKFALWNDDIIQEVTADEETLYNFQQDVNHEHFSLLEFRPKQRPMASWPVAMVTKQKYRFHWGEGLDFEEFKIEMSKTWLEDEYVKLMTNHTDVRVHYNMTYKGNTVENGTYNLNQLKWESGANVAYNDTETREFHFLLMGKDLKNREILRLQAYRCVVDCTENDVIEEEEISDEKIYWSDPESWPSGVLPVEGDEVEIESSWNMVLDIDTPILEKLTINGRLSFLNNLTDPKNITLHAKKIYVRAGELLIGSEEEPFAGNAEIRLYGGVNDETIAFSQAVEGGNKLLAIVGMAKMYGQPRDTMSRLKGTVYKGGKHFVVSKGLDWAAGDRIALLPTATQHNHTEYHTLAAYDPDTGLAEIEDTLKYYHWGAATSTGNKYEGVDMRGEVIMLSRNVRIVGNDTESWGGQVVVADNLEFETMTKRTGQLVLDYVEVYNCSQRNTFHSAIRFEGVKTLPQLINNTAIHHSTAWHLKVALSENVHIENTHMLNSRAIGLNVYTSNNVTLKNNIVADVGVRPEFSGQKLVDKEACYSVCVFYGGENCKDITITGNIAAGCPYAGFIVPAHDCGESETQQSFRDNVAHSVNGVGAHITPVEARGHGRCYEGSYFAAYKVLQNGISNFYTTNEVRMSHMKMIDNTLGVSIQTAGELPKLETYFTDSHVWGESDQLSEDCPMDHDCICVRKSGHWLSSGSHKGKDFHITSLSALPSYKSKSYQAWAPASFIERVIYEDFSSQFTRCGAPQSIFMVNPSHSDYIPLQRYDAVEFVNVADSAVAWLMDPKPDWANPDDCVGFPCTAPSNIVMKFKNSRFSGSSKPDFSDTQFQVISDTPGASDKINGCEFKEIWNAWFCKNNKLGVLNFNADDEDWEDKNASPTYITNDETGFVNKVNIQMDHMWDGFYTGQKHKSQMTSFLESDRNYTIEYTGTPYKHMRYQYHGDIGQIKLRILYWNAGSYHVYVDNKKIDYTPWDEVAGRPQELSGYRGCGENRYVGVDNYLEFILTPGCTVTVKPVDAILTNVRMQWTLAEFYDQGGVTSFVDRVSAALGIHASRIKVVAVYKGSVVVDYNIEADVEEDGTEEAVVQLRRTERKLKTLLTDKTSAGSIFGAPVLSASSSGEVVINDPSYTPPVSTVVSITKQLTAAEVELPPEQEALIHSIVNEQKVTIETEEERLITDQETRTMLWILGLIVVLMFCCVGFGATVLCYLRSQAQKTLAQAAKRPKAAERAQQVLGESSALSDAEVREQYNPEDIDIFATNKKRLKMNEYDQYETEKKMIPDQELTQHDRSSIIGLAAHNESATVEFVAKKHVADQHSLNEVSRV